MIWLVIGLWALTAVLYFALVSWPEAHDRLDRIDDYYQEGSPDE